MSVEQFEYAVCDVFDPALLVVIHAVIALTLVHSLNLAEVVTPSFWPAGGSSTSWAHGLLP